MSRLYQTGSAANW